MSLPNTIENRLKKPAHKTHPREPSWESIEQCGQGNTEVLKSFFNSYAKEIYNFPLKVFHLDEDAASDFFLYAYKRLEDGSRFRSYQRRSSFRTWFYTVLRNLVIDWMRTLREIETVDINAKQDKDQNFDMIANTADPRSLLNEENEISPILCMRLHAMPIEMRTILKLAYIYYLDLESEELEYLSKRSGIPTTELMEELLQLRHNLSVKELKNISSEDKITSLYLSVIQLKVKKGQLENMIKKQNMPDDSKLRELDRIEHSISKKLHQRERLLHKKERGHFVVRTPYRYVASILKTSEGNISVQMMRILERLRDIVAT